MRAVLSKLKTAEMAEKEEIWRLIRVLCQAA